MSERSNVTSHPQRSWAAVLTVLTVAGLLVAADLGSKAWAVENLSRGRFGGPSDVCQPDGTGWVTMARVPTGPKVVVENFFEFRYAENCGAAFGILNSTKSIWKNVLFFGAAIGAVVALLYSFRTGRGGRWFVVAVPTIIAGAIGNFTDRIRLGYVVDFIRFYFRAWEYPTFNIADVAITVGVIALLMDSLYEGRREREAASRLSKSLADVPEDDSTSGSNTALSTDVPPSEGAAVAPGN